jgi:hypothetical protein
LTDLRVSSQSAGTKRRLEDTTRERKRGRHHKAYVTNWGATFPGLTRVETNRCRAAAIGDRFNESDECLAVKRFIVK